MIEIVDLSAEYQKIEKELSRNLKRVLSKGRFVLGENVAKFEEEFARYCGVKYAVGVNSGTDALFLSLLSLGIGPEDEVISPVFTFIATAFAISFTGAKPVLIDVDPKTYNIDPQKIEDYLISKSKSQSKSRVKAIIPVHLYGHPADMQPIMEIAKEYNLKIVEDCAQAHGAEYQFGSQELRAKNQELGTKRQKVGSMGDIGCFSFYPTKNLGAYGDGGIAVTNSEEIYKKLRQLRDCGRASRYEHTIKGYNSRLDEIQAAILRVKLKHLDRWNDARRKNAELYNELLRNSGLVTPTEESYAKHVYHLYVIRTKHREELQGYLDTWSISTLIHYPIPVHLQKAYEELGYQKGDFPVAEKLAREVLSLPMHPGLEKNEIAKVCNCLNDFFHSV